eukprot:365443-Chlamydomonas_euryale.AAC.6
MPFPSLLCTSVRRICTRCACHQALTCMHVFPTQKQSAVRPPSASPATTNNMTRTQCGRTARTTALTALAPDALASVGRRSATPPSQLTDPVRPWWKRPPAARPAPANPRALRERHRGGCLCAGAGTGAAAAAGAAGAAAAAARLLRLPGVARVCSGLNTPRGHEVAASAATLPTARCVHRRASWHTAYMEKTNSHMCTGRRKRRASQPFRATALSGSRAASLGHAVSSAVVDVAVLSLSAVPRGAPDADWGEGVREGAFLPTS